MRRLKVDLVDEHFYRNENWFLNLGNRYDNYDRRGPKVFAGEYACHGNGKKFNHFNAALMEAAFMTGLERNADVVHMATYAPLLAHIKGWQWRPDLIWFDNSRIAPSASYYVQQLYAANKGSRVLPLVMADGKPAAGNPGQNGLFASAVIDNESNSIIIKAVNTSDEDINMSVGMKLPKKSSLRNDVEMITLKADAMAENTLDNPTAVLPVNSVLKLSGTTEFSDSLPAGSFRVYRLKLEQK